MISRFDHDPDNDAYFDRFGSRESFQKVESDFTKNGLHKNGTWPKRHLFRYNERKPESWDIEFYKGYYDLYNDDHKTHQEDSLYLDHLDFIFKCHIGAILYEIAPGYDENDDTVITKEKWLNTKIDLDKYDEYTKKIYLELDE